MSLEPNNSLQMRSDYPDYSKPIGDGVAQALQDYAAAHRLTMENISLRQQLAAANAEIAHWKNNHATEVRRARILKERTDMPIERVQAYERWCLDLAENAALRQQLSEKDAVISRLQFALADTEALELGTAERLAASQLHNTQLRENVRVVCGPVMDAFTDGQRWNDYQELIDQPTDTSALETQLIAAQQRAAEACAKVCIAEYADLGDSWDRQKDASQACAKAIRNGEWREYL